MTILHVRHVTTYRYRRPVSFGDHRMMFRPRDAHDQRLIACTQVITPEPALIRWIHDVFGNSVAIAQFRGPATELRFESAVTVDQTSANTPDFTIEDSARHFPFTYGADELPDLGRLIERQYLDPEKAVDRWARTFINKGRPTETGTLLATLTHAIRESFVYERRSQHGTQDPITTLRLRRGTCRDFALLMMEAVRSLGLAARFVSGYLYVPDRDQTTYLGGGATHAWCQVYLPGAGWVEFDPTNGIIGSRDLIRVAVTRDPRQAVPLSGTWFGSPGDSLGMEIVVQVSTDPPPKAAAADARGPALATTHA